MSFGVSTKPTSAMQGTHTMQYKLPSLEQVVPQLAIRPFSMLTSTRFQEEGH